MKARAYDAKIKMLKFGVFAIRRSIRSRQTYVCDSDNWKHRSSNKRTANEDFSKGNKVFG